MLEEARELGEWSKECEALSIYQELSKIEDTRGQQGKRYLTVWVHSTPLRQRSSCDRYSENEPLAIENREPSLFTIALSLKTVSYVERGHGS